MEVQDLHVDVWFKMLVRVSFLALARHKTKYVEFCFLYVQEFVASGMIRVQKVLEL